MIIGSAVNPCSCSIPRGHRLDRRVLPPSCRRCGSNKIRPTGTKTCSPTRSRSSTTSPRCATATQLHLGELVDQLARFLVAVLDGRALHEVRGWAEQRAADAAVVGDFAAAEGVDDHAGRVGGVPYLELELDVEGHVAEVAAFDTDVGPFAVVEPRHMVARADVDVVVGDALIDLAGD